MNIPGTGIRLMPAREADRRKIYRWLCKSDLTSSMMGPPENPEHPVPTWKEFCDQYPLSFFNSSGDGTGRVFIIVADSEEVGTVGYDLLDAKRDRVVLDIWMKAERYCGHGYGSDALNALSLCLNKNYGIRNFLISPSARNKRAIAAYKKAGFETVKVMDKKEQEKEFGLSEYDENVFMIKKLITK